MKVEITYCGNCNHLPRAAGLAAEIRKARGVDAVLVKSSGGVFDVAVDGQVIFSKQKEGRFPEAAELIERIPAA